MQGKARAAPFAGGNVEEYEKRLLGAYVEGAEIGRGMTEAVFDRAAHGIVFGAIRDMRASGGDADLLRLVSELRRRGRLDAAGGYAAVASLTDSVPSAANTAFYEGEVMAAHRGRSALRAASEAKEALECGEPPEDVVARLSAKLAAVAPGGEDADAGMLFSDLLGRQFPPDDWLVEGLLSTGLSVLTGASKIGKSWTALQLVTALDQGGFFLGSLRARRTDVLYCALEDTPRRIQARVRKQGAASFNGSRLETRKRSPAALRAFLTANPQFGVVVIDTLQKMLGLADVNDYAQSVEGMGVLKNIADDLNIAIVVIHHNRKGGDADGDHMESALGSTGINSTADTTLTMRRRRGTSEATLSVTGRDVEDSSYTMSWDKDVCSWTLTEKSALRPDLPEAQRQIAELLESEARVWTTAEIAGAIGIRNYEVSRQVAELARKGVAEKAGYGQWRAKPTADGGKP